MARREYLVVSAIEHPCVLAAAERYFGQGRQQHIPVTADGVVDVEWLAKALKIKAPALVAVMAANNETGVIQPWREMLSLCREHGVAFFCDAAQWVGKLPGEGPWGRRFRERVRAQVWRAARRGLSQSAGFEISGADRRRAAGGRDGAQGRKMWRVCWR